MKETQRSGTGYVDHAAGTKTVDVGEELLGVLTLPVPVSEDRLAFYPVDFLPSRAVKDAGRSDSRICCRFDENGVLQHDIRRLRQTVQTT